MVGVAAAPGIPARVLSPLQDELLPAEPGVLVTHPAAETERARASCASNGVLPAPGTRARLWVRGGVGVWPLPTRGEERKRCWMWLPCP